MRAHRVNRAYLFPRRVDGSINKRVVKTFLSSLRRVARPLIKITRRINRGETGVGEGNMNLSFFPRHVRGRVINIALQALGFLRALGRDEPH